MKEKYLVQEDEPTTFSSSGAPVSRIGDGLTKCSVGAYAIGHVYNDLCAAVWFNYLLFYVTKVVNVPPAYAGFVMLSGQLADGFMTPLVGICSDKTTSPCGKRTPWYIFGSLLVFPSFYGLFWDCVVCDSENPSFTLLIAYYITLPAIFNIGWASVQIANMALIAQLSYSETRRDTLVNYRTAFTYISNFVVLLASFIIFLFINDAFTGFRALNVLVTLIGITCSICYILLVPELKFSKLANQFKNQTNPPSSQTTNPKTHKKYISWNQWLSRSQLYFFAGVYKFTRLAINVYSSIFPFYLKEVLLIGGSGSITEMPFELALIPMINYSCSSLFSLLFNKKLSEYFNNRYSPYFIGIVLFFIGSLPLYWLDSTVKWPVYFCSGINGVCFSIFLNTSVSCISDVIGEHAESGAFVYGFYSFLDKVFSGLVLYFVTAYGISEMHSIRMETILIPLISSVLAFCLLYVGSKRRESSLRELEELRVQVPLISGGLSQELTLDDEAYP